MPRRTDPQKLELAGRLIEHLAPVARGYGIERGAHAWRYVSPPFAADLDQNAGVWRLQLVCGRRRLFLAQWNLDGELWIAQLHQPETWAADVLAIRAPGEIGQ